MSLLYEKLIITLNDFTKKKRTVDYYRYALGLKSINLIVNVLQGRVLIFSTEDSKHPLSGKTHSYKYKYSGTDYIWDCIFKAPQSEGAM